MDKKGPTLQQVGIFITIPFVLLASPMVGWFIGRWLDKKLDTSPYLMYVFLFLGFIAGVWDCYRLIKEYGNEE